MIFCLLLLCSVIASPRRLSGEGPPQPPSFNPGGKGRVDRSIYKDHELKMAAKYNKAIPPSSDNLVRFATWNTHMLLNLQEEYSSVPAFLDDLNSIQADILLLEEIPGKLSRNWGGRVLFEEGLEKLGYCHRRFVISEEPESELGILVASRFPIGKVNKYELGFKRILVDAEVSIASSIIHILGTHLEVRSAEARADQVSFIAKHLKESKFYEGNFLIAGDMNSIYSSDSLSSLWGNHKEIKEAFRGLTWPHPEYTCWSGAEIDFVGVGDSIFTLLAGAYVFHSATSDHLPIIIDLGFGPTSKSFKSKSFIVDEDKTNSLKLLAFVIFLVAVIYILAIKFLPRSAWNNAYRYMRDFEAM